MPHIRIIHNSYRLFAKIKSYATTPCLLALVGVIIGLGACSCEEEEPKDTSTELGRLVAQRPIVDLTRLAERSSPSYSGEDSTGSFYDILKLREVGDTEAVTVLDEILVEHAGSTRIHGFAAAQALFCIGTSEAHSILTKHLLSSQYNAQLSINYTYHWEMVEPKRSQFIKRYHLQNLSKDLALELKAIMHEVKDGQLIDFTVTLHNVSRRPLELWDRQVYLGQMLYFQRRDGSFARTERTVEYEYPPPRIRKLQSSATHEYNIAVHVNDVAQSEHRLKWLSEDAEILAGTSDVMFELERAGRFKVYAMFEQQTLSQTQIDHFKLDSPWSGRAVSDPVMIDISLQK